MLAMYLKEGLSGPMSGVLVSLLQNGTGYTVSRENVLSKADM